MFERYTEKARRAIFFARYEGSQLGSHSIESEHLLLGVLRENKALHVLFPTSPGAIGSMRTQIEQHAHVGQMISTSVDLPLSDECSRILGYAAEEADHFSHRFIRTEHLLLGILREPTCFAANLLRERGVSLESARTQIGGMAPEAVGSIPTRRNDPCPCGSGKKYKKCHGASVPPGADPMGVTAEKPKSPKAGKGAAAVNPETEPEF